MKQIITHKPSGIRVDIVAEHHQNITFAGIEFSQPHLFAALQKWGYTQEQAIEIMTTKVRHLNGGR